MRVIEIAGHVPDIPVNISNDKLLEVLEEIGMEYLITLPESPYEVLLINLIEKKSIKLIQVCKESEGIGICAGLTYGGKKAAILCSFKGLYNSIDSILGVAIKASASFLILVSDADTKIRNSTIKAEGGIFTADLLSAITVPFYIVESNADLGCIKEALEQTKTSTKPIAIILRW